MHASVNMMNVTTSVMEPRMPVNINTIELQRLEHLLNHENMFEMGVVRAYEC